MKIQIDFTPLHFLHIFYFIPGLQTAGIVSGLKCQTSEGHLWNLKVTFRVEMQPCCREMFLVEQFEWYVVVFYKCASAAHAHKSGRYVN